MHFLAVVAAMSGVKARLTTFQLSNRVINSQLFVPTTPRPVTSYRLTTAGEAQEREGDTDTSGTYQRISTDYLEGGTFDTSDYEVEFVVDSETGASGTWSGSTRGTGVWNDLGTERAWEWEKDTNNAGFATANVTVTIREIAVPANLVTASITFQSWIEI